MRIFVHALIAALAGCGTYDAADRLSLTDYEVGDDQVDFRITFDRWRQPDDPGAEETRLAWLDEFMTRNRICPNGYEITDRRVYVISYGGQVHYRAACL